MIGFIAAMTFLVYALLAVLFGPAWAKFRWNSWLAWDIGLPSAAVTERVGRHPFLLRLRMGLLWPFFFDLLASGSLLYASEVRKRPDEFQGLASAYRDKDEAQKHLAYQRYECLISFVFPIQFLWSLSAGLFFLLCRFSFGACLVMLNFIIYWVEHGFRTQGWKGRSVEDFFSVFNRTYLLPEQD